MQIDLDTLPDDPAILQQMLRDVVATAAHQHGTLQAENDKLRLLIQRLLRQQFGPRSEQLSPDQLQLGLEDLEQSIAENQAGQDAAEAQQGRRRPAPRRNHGALPEHLPRYEVLIDIERRDCPAAVTRCMPLASFAPSSWTSCLPNSGSGSPAARAMPAGPARAQSWWRLRRSGRSMAAWRPTR